VSWALGSGVGTLGLEAAEEVASLLLLKQVDLVCVWVLDMSHLLGEVGQGELVEDLHGL